MLDYHESEAALRNELREMIQEHMPEDFLGAFTKDRRDMELAQRFCKKLAERNLLTLGWPSEFGGRDASIWEQTVLREEMWAFHEPRGAQYMGLNWVGPVVMMFGSDEQKATHLSTIGRGEVIWCQGFSEPDAGSDLASLRTSARRDGDGWCIHGQKVWTSYATMADWCFLLARTSSTDDKRFGITVFLLPMDRPGIKVRPIESMVGPHHLNEMFFDGAWAGPEDVLGEVDRGWDVVRAALSFERVGIARYARCERLLNLGPQVLGPDWEELPESLRQRWAIALLHARQARLLAYRAIALQGSGKVDLEGPAGYRIAVTQLDQETAEVLMDIVQERAVGTADRSDIFARAVEDHWRYAQAATVASGSIEMQRMAVARSVLDKR